MKPQKRGWGVRATATGLRLSLFVLQPKCFRRDPPWFRGHCSDVIDSFKHYLHKQLFFSRYVSVTSIIVPPGSLMKSLISAVSGYLRPQNLIKGLDWPQRRVCVCVCLKVGVEVRLSPVQTGNKKRWKSKCCAVWGRRRCRGGVLSQLPACLSPSVGVYLSLIPLSRYRVGSNRHFCFRGRRLSEGHQHTGRTMLTLLTSMYLVVRAVSSQVSWTHHRPFKRLTSAGTELTVLPWTPH